MTEIEKLSDFLKADEKIRALMAQEGRRLPEAEVAAYFINMPHGPEFFRCRGPQPLFDTPAHEGQAPVAFTANAGGHHLFAVTPEQKALYRDDIEWTPLYLARG